MLAQNIAHIKERLSALSLEAGYGITPKLIAVTKLRTTAEINALAELNVLDIGENRVQECLEKKPFLDERFYIHHIGRLQSNKVKYIIELVCQIQSVDRLSLAEEIHRRAMECGRVMPVLIQVSPAGEASKGGVPFGEARDLITRISRLEGLRIGGLMAVMPQIADTSVLGGLFHRTRLLFERMQEEAINHTDMQELSMGMSGDYELAVLNGATTVRLGSAVFARQEG